MINSVNQEAVSATLITVQTKLSWQAKHIASQVREGWFSFRVVNPWNELPDNVVDAPSIKTFKSRLDEHLDLS